MYWLPVAMIGDQKFHLPISADQSVLLGNLLLSQVDSTDLLRCLQKAPTLLVWLSAVGSQQGVDMTDIKQVEHFAKHELLRELSGDCESMAPDGSQSQLAEICNQVSTPESVSTILFSTCDMDLNQSQAWITENICQGYFSNEQESESDSEQVCDISRLVQILQHYDRLYQTFDSTLRNEKLLAIKHLAYGASHEINNPLANISARAESLLAGEQDPDRRQKLAMISQQAYRAHEMISDLMLFANPPKLNLAPFNIKELLESALCELQSFANTKNVVLNLTCDDVEPDDFSVHADKTQISVAIKAVIQNSLEATPGNGSIECCLACNQKRGVVVTISDIGMGIDESISKNIFDPYFSGREAGRGLGFGLSKSWRIIQLHGGSIDVLPNSPRGTKVVINIPAN